MNPSHDLQSVLTELRENQVKIWLDGERIRYRTMQGALSEKLRALIRENRQVLIEFLNSQEIEQSTSHDIPLIDRTIRIPLSHVEERLWFITAMSRDRSVFENQTAFEIVGGLNVDALERAINLLIARHEIFRTRYVIDQGELSRSIDNYTETALQIVDISEDNNISVDNQVKRIIQSERAKKFDLTAEPAFRVSLLRLHRQRFVLLVKLHHIIYDDKSMELIWKELGQLYDAVLQNHVDSLSPISIQYADYAMWHRDITNTRIQKSLEYWEQKLTDAPPVLDLPLDFNRPIQQKFSGDIVSCELTTSQREGVSKLSALTGSTPYMIFLAVFSLLLHRYSGQQTILVGSPITNRKHDALSSVIGCFLDTLVLRTDFDSDITFISHLKNVKQTTLDAFDHQNVPFEKIVEMLQPERNTGIHPVYQVLFNFLQGQSENQGLQLSELDVNRYGKKVYFDADYDLKLTAVDRNDKIICSFNFDKALFHKSTISRLMENFLELLNCVVDTPDKIIHRYEMLAPAEKQLVLYDWNKTSVCYPSDKTLTELFEYQVELNPNKVALIFEDKNYSYASLNEKANQLAHFLLAKGLKRQSVVAVHLERSIEVSISLLAILKIGAIYLPLDAAYPLARKTNMLELSNADYLITVNDLDQAVNEKVSVTVILDTDASELATMPKSNLNVSVGAEEYAYIVFTSGSTGSPKGACIPHRQILNRLHWMWKEYPFNDQDLSCQKTAISFVDSLWELLGPLLIGSPSVVFTDKTTHDLSLFMQQLESHKVTRIWLVPTLLYILVESVKNKRANLSALNFVVVTGEQLNTSLANEFRSNFPQVALYNLYGTSEAWDSTWFEVHNVDLNRTTVPIGKPIDNTQMYILDSQLNPVPIGVTGQLHVGGDGLAAYFINNDKRAADELIAKPWAKNEKMHASGDSARYLPDGNIELLGRNNRQLNVRGYRVHPIEIEKALERIPGVMRCAIHQRSISDNSSELIAFICLENEQTSEEIPSQKTIRNKLELQLPVFMIPNQFIFLDDFPLTPSGKVDRIALAQLEQKNVDNQAELDVAHSEMELELLRIWESVLPGRSIKIHDNFFDIGGHSLLAIELFDKIGRLVDTKLELTLLFEASTIKKQADVLQNITCLRGSNGMVPIQSEGSKIPLFFVPPLGGTGLNYRKISEYLGDDQPVYTFDLSFSENDSSAYESIEVMSERFLKYIKSVQPQGPYCVGGMCFGGLVAWDISRQLIEKGDELGSVILLDPSVPFTGPNWKVRKTVASPWDRIKNGVSQLIKNRFNSSIRSRLKNRLVAINAFNPNNSLYRFHQLKLQHSRAWHVYKGQHIRANTLMICSREFIDRNNYLERWKSMIGGDLTLEILDGSNHIEMLTESDLQMKQMCEMIERYMENIQK